MEFINKLKDIAGLITATVAIIGLIIAGYKGYTDVITKVDDNLNQIEKTQVMILKKNVREFEHNVCASNDNDWDEYIENYSLLYEIKMKHKRISKNTPWKPMLRITNGTEAEKCSN